LLEEIGAGASTRPLRELLALASGETDVPTQPAAAPVVAPARPVEPEETNQPMVPADLSQPVVTTDRRPRPRAPTPGTAQVALAYGDLAIRVTYRSSLNYALVFNGVPPIVAVELDNIGDVALDPGPLFIDLQAWDGAGDTEPLVIEAGSVGPRQ